MDTLLPELVGRDAELEAIEVFLAPQEGERPSALLIEGEAGIGKTTLSKPRCCSPSPTARRHNPT